MKKLFAIFLLLSITTICAEAQTTYNYGKDHSINDKLPEIDGTDIFSLNIRGYCLNFINGKCIYEIAPIFVPQWNHYYSVELTDLGQNKIIELPYLIRADRPYLYWEKRKLIVTYSNGLIIYSDSDSKKYGAIDLEGNTIIPFKYKKIQDVLKSEEYKDYVMSPQCRKILEKAKELSRFIVIKNKLDDYRRSRFLSDDFLQKAFKNSEDIIFLRRVETSTGNSILDSRFNYITNFIKGNITIDDLDRIKGTTLDKVVTNMVNLNMEKWYKKDEFESIAEFKARTTPEMCRRAQEYYASAAVKLFLDLKMPRPFELGAYDRENESFLIESPVGNVVLKVPFEESISFRNAWEHDEITFSNAEFSTIDDGVTLTELTVKHQQPYIADTSTPYTRYIMDGRTNVASPVIAVVKNPNPIEQQNINPLVNQGTKKVTPADVDLDIPSGTKHRENAFALIIANENYQKLSDVSFARNDGETLAQYCTKTLGIPDNNVKTYFDATYGQMRQALTDMRQIADAFRGDIDLVVYYAGHGAPDEATARAYLLPVDAAGVNSDYCLERDFMLKEIADMNARSAVVIFDACFTGAERTEQSGKMLASVRGVEIEPVGPELPVEKSGILIFNATSGRQSAIPDKDNSHGLFTYFLLKKLRESRGDVNLGDLWNYLESNVSRRSAVLGKVQRPSVYASGAWEFQPFLR